MNAAQQTTWRKGGRIGRASADARWLPPLEADATRAAGYRFVAAAQGGDASRLGNNGGDADASGGVESLRGAEADVARASGHSQTPSPPRFYEQRIGRRSTLTAVGEIDMSTAADLHRALETAADSGASEIWLDLTPTTFMDCSGLRVLLDLRASLRKADRRLVLICPAGPVLRLLTLTRVDREFEIRPTRAAAEYAD